MSPYLFVIYLILTAQPNVTIAHYSVSMNFLPIFKIWLHCFQEWLTSTNAANVTTNDNEKQTANQTEKNPTTSENLDDITNN